jgi:transposase
VFSAIFLLHCTGFFDIIILGYFYPIEFTRRNAMFLDFKVKIPDAPGKLVRKNRKGQTYIEYEYERTYDPVKQYTYPKRASIGRVDPEDPTMMTPNSNFLKYFPDAELPEEKSRDNRSPYLHIGAYAVLHKLALESGLDKILLKNMEEKDAMLLLDLALYSIVSENNAAQYYPDYAYDHALFTPEMRIYSDSHLSDFLRKMDPQQPVLFLNEWNSSRNKRQKIYVSYDSTNKSCQAGDIDIAEYGNAKVDEGQPIFNYSVAFDTNNREPLFYERYPGSINDVSQLTCMIDKARGYGYKKLGFILDRGYFSRKNLTHIVQNGYSYLIMMKGMKRLVRDIVLSEMGTFENSRRHYNDRYDRYGITLRRALFPGDEQEAYFHLYYSDGKAYGEKQRIKERIRQMGKYLNDQVGRERVFGDTFEKYFYLHYEKDGKTFKFAEEKTKVIEEELSLAGYFVILSSDKLTAREALDLYKGRDASEKLFRSDKSYLGNRTMRVASNEAQSAKIFIQFIALILRCRIYTDLKAKCESMTKRPNYMTVPAALKELEKIVMIRQLDGCYRLDHAVTKTQKTILSAFGMTDGNIKGKAKEIEKLLQEGKR